MRNESYFKYFSRLKSEKQQILGITFLQIVALYLVLPLYAAYLLNEKMLNNIQVATVIGMSSLSTLFFAPILFIVIRKKSFIPILPILFFITGSLFFLIPLTFSYYIFIVYGILLGFSNSVTTPLMKNILSQNEQEEDIDFIFRLRYAILCAGIIIAPVLGNVINIYKITFVFYFAGFIYLILFFWMYILIKKINLNFPRESIHSKFDLKFIGDKKIFIIVIMNILVTAVFGFFEEATPLALNTWTKNIYVIFSYLIILNSILVIVLTPIAAFVCKRLGIKKTINLGLILFVVSYMFFSISANSFIVLTLSVIIFSFAESFTLPSLDTIVSINFDNTDTMSVFALMELKQVGFFIAPVIISIGITLFSMKITYFFVVFFTLITALFFNITFRFLYSEKKDVEASIEKFAAEVTAE